MSILKPIILSDNSVLFSSDFSCVLQELIYIYIYIYIVASGCSVSQIILYLVIQDEVKKCQALHTLKFWFQSLNSSKRQGMENPCVTVLCCMDTDSDIYGVDSNGTISAEYGATSTS